MSLAASMVTTPSASRCTLTGADGAGEGQFAFQLRHAAAQQPPAGTTRDDCQHKQQQRQALDPLQHASPRWPISEGPAQGRPRVDYSTATMTGGGCLQVQLQLIPISPWLAPLGHHARLTPKERPP